MQIQSGNDGMDAIDATPGEQGLSICVLHTGTGCPKKWQMLHPWKHSRPGWMGL